MARSISVARDRRSWRCSPALCSGLVRRLRSYPPDSSPPDSGLSDLQTALLIPGLNHQ